MVTEEYKKSVRSCTIRINKGVASDDFKDTVVVDWSYVLMGVTGIPGQEFLLGIDPRLPSGAAWVDDSLQYAPPPDWAVKDTYITALEAENAELKKQLAEKS